MPLPIEPLRVTSLKEACISRLEELILSGEIKTGEHLPAERDLAARLGVSRPVLHESLVDLAAKGLVTINPRRGVVVNDLRKFGSFAILSSLLSYHNGELAPQFVSSLFSMRLLVETETARLAAMNASADQIAELREIIYTETKLDRADTAGLTEMDFEFHLAISIASENMAYPLILNSFKSVYTHFTSAFFTKTNETSVIDEVYLFHQQLVDAIESRSADQSAALMRALLLHGEKHLNS